MFKAFSHKLGRWVALRNPYPRSHSADVRFLALHERAKSVLTTANFVTLVKIKPLPSHRKEDYEGLTINGCLKDGR